MKQRRNRVRHLVQAQTEHAWVLSVAPRQRRLATEVFDLDSGADVFTGLLGTSHDLLSIRVDRSQLRYRKHILEGGSGHGDTNDTVSGCADIASQIIDSQCNYTSERSGQLGVLPGADHRQDWLPGRVLERRLSRFLWEPLLRAEISWAQIRASCPSTR